MATDRLRLSRHQRADPPLVVAQAAYTAPSARARASLSTPLYSTLSSFVCAVKLLLVCHLAR